MHVCLCLNSKPHQSDPRLMAEMVLPLLSLSFSFHSREPTNLRTHSGGLLRINSPSIQGTCCFHIHSEEDKKIDIFLTNLTLNTSFLQLYQNLMIHNSSVVISDPFISMSDCVSL